MSEGSPSTQAPQKAARRGLKRKLVLSMLAVGALPLLIGLTMAFFTGMQEIRVVSGTSFEALAEETARMLDLVVNQEIAATAHIATDQDIIEALEVLFDEHEALDQRAAEDLLAQENRLWTDKNPQLMKAITEGPLSTVLRRYTGGMFLDPGHPIPVVRRTATRGMFITDSRGRLVASTGSNVDYDHHTASWWKGAFSNGVGQPYLTNVAFNQQVGTYTFSLSLPIMDRLHFQTIGVLHRIYDAKEFFSPSIDTIRFGKTGHVMLIDSRGTVMSCPILPTGTHLADPRLIPLVTPLTKGWVKAPSDGHGGQNTSIIGHAPLPGTSQITESSTGAAWHMFVWQSSEELFAPIEYLFTWITVFGSLAVGLLIMLGAVAAGRIVTPIRQLQDAARQIGHGELKDRIVIKTGDELEELAEEVNSMNEKLQAAFAGLTSEVELKTQEVQYLQESTAQILDGVPDPVIMFNKELRIEYLNRSSQETFRGKHAGEGIGLPLFEFLETDQRTQHKLRRELHAMALESPAGSSQENLVQKEGSYIPRDPLSPASKSETHRHEIQYHNQIFRYQWFTVGARPGQDHRLGMVLRETTEESRLQERLIQGEKLASLGVLSAGIGHELNNPLVGVIGLGEAIQEEHDSNQIKEYAKNIVQHGKRMASIIRDFTGQATSKAGGRLASVNINEQLEQALQTIRESQDITDLEISTNFQSLPPIKANPHELSQAFTNIITNAVQAMGRQGRIEILTVDKETNVHITIKDNGSGISPPHLSKIFDPFFTTKRQGEGAGLGLTIARRILAKYQGQIHIESEEGTGTTCHITIPLHPQEGMKGDVS